MCLAVPVRILSTSGEDPLLRSARIDFGDAAEAERVFQHLEEIGAIEEERGAGS